MATVLVELVKKLDAERLALVARIENGLPTAQRVGYLLEQVGARETASSQAAWIEERRPRFVPLRPDRFVRRAAKDSRWRVLVNERVEVDT